MRALITGVSSGIGAGVAKHLLGKGWDISGLDIQKCPIDKIEYHQIDLGNPTQVKGFIENFNRPIDALIYCAGIREIKNPCDLLLSEWTKVFDVNLNSSFIIAQNLITKALEFQQTLNIINIASISGIQAEQDRAAYVSSKFALVGLTKQLAFQFGFRGIRCNAIAPGIIETPLTKDYFADEELAIRIKKATPVGYWGQIEHMTSIIDLLLANSYMNGSVIVCDGGWTAGKEI